MEKEEKKDWIRFFIILITIYLFGMFVVNNINKHYFEMQKEIKLEIEKEKLKESNEETLKYNVIAVNTEEAKYITEKFFKGIKESDFEQIKLTVKESTTYDLFDTISMPDDIQLNKFNEKLSNIEIKYIDGDIVYNENEGVLKYNYKGPSLNKLIYSLINYEDIENIESVDKDIEVKFQREFDGLRISNPIEIINNL